MNTEPMSIPYARILDNSRDKALKLDLGEGQPVWFPRSRVTLDETAYTLTAPADLITTKQAEARGEGTGYSDFDQEMIKLAAPAWQADDGRSIGIDIMVSRLDRGRDAIRKRVFFPTSQLTDGCAPRWLVNKKEEEVLTDLCRSGRYGPENFRITGLRGKAKAAA